MLVTVFVLCALLLLFLKVRASVNTSKPAALPQVQSAPEVRSPESETNPTSKPAVDKASATPSPSREAMKIYFDFNRASINKNVYCILDKIVQTVHGLGGQNFRIMVEGNADSIGPASYNVVLSRSRAARVADSLSGRLGIPLSRIELVANGSSKPIASNRTSEGRAENRRTEVHILF